MRVEIRKSLRQLTLWDGARPVLRARVALGREPAGPKRRAGDQKTPEGEYRICLARENGKYGLSLGLDYPNAADARLALAEGAIDATTLRAVETALAQGRRPPWGSALGGEIYLHEGPVDTDWTAGCVALEHEAMAALYALRGQIEAVVIYP